APALLAKFSALRDRRDVKAALCLDPADVEATCFLAFAEALSPEAEPSHQRMARAEIIAIIARSAVLVGRLAEARGRSLQAMGRYSQASDPFRRAILLNPSEPDRFFDFGRSEFESGRPDVAGRQVLRTLLMRPNAGGSMRREVRVLVARLAGEIDERPGYRCEELAESFSVKINPVGQPGPRIDYRVPATFLARADNARLLFGHHSVILPDDTVLLEGLTYSQKRRHWDGPCYAYISSKDTILAALPAPEPRIEGEAVLLGGGVNYYHNVVDWLSRLPTILEHPKLADLPVLVARTVPASVIEILEMFGLARDRLRLLTPGLYPVDRLWIPSLAHGRLGCVSPKYLAFLEERLFSQFRDPRTRGRRRLYFARRNDGHRLIVNAEEMNALLSKYGFETVELERLSAAEQFKLAAEAEVVVAPFGAGLTNVLACPIACTVIELTHHQAVRPLFPILTGLRGQAFYRVTGRPMGSAAVTLPMHDDFEIPAEALETVLRQALS
ncbi:MAG: glycosyltransferase family 61 protein, partial [Proteobacteria bacterium]|nr:glycosyltransferase family 61 protein [Pseudomonadota bacterium]